jgi:hypothetical protein
MESASLYGNLTKRAVGALSTESLTRSLEKAHQPHLLADTGNYITRYDGVKLWYQMSTEDNPWGIIPKTEWGANEDRMDGWRVVTALVTAPKNTFVTEAGNLPDEKKSTRAAIYTVPRDAVFVFGSSMRNQRAGVRNQSISWDKDIEEAGINHKYGLAQHMALPLGTFEANYPDSFFPFDKVISSRTERSSCTNDYRGNAIAAADVDIYGVDRHTTVSWADAYVNENGATVRALTTTVLYNTLRTTFINSGDAMLKPSKCMFMGTSTWVRLSQMEEGKQRFGMTTIDLSQFNGVTGVPGQNIGFSANAFMGIPIIPTLHIADQTSGVAPIYIPDFDYLKFWVDYPTLYHEAGTRSGNELLLGALRDRGMFRTGGQTACRKFSAQAKVRDIV